MSASCKDAKARIALSVFDLDHTLIDANGSYEFCRYLHRMGELELGDLLLMFYYNLRHKLFPMPIPLLYKKVFFRLCFGKNLCRMKELAHAFVAQIPSELFNQSVLERLAKAKLEQQKVLILSSSPEFLVEAFADRLGVRSFAGTTLEVDREGMFCDLGQIMEGSRKATFFEHFSALYSINMTQTIVYSDSSLDLPICKKAGAVVAVNPDKKLRKYCKNNGYEIVFKN